MNGTMTKGDKIFNIVNDIIMALLCVIMIYPVLFVVGRSVTPEIERAMHPLRLIPSTFDWSGYKFILSSGSNIVNSYLTTITRTLIGTTLNLIFTTLLAYPLSKNYYPLRKPLTAMIVFTMWFSGGLIPSFLLNKSLGLLNNFWVYILPCLVNPFNMIVLRNFFGRWRNPRSWTARTTCACSSPSICRCPPRRWRPLPCSTRCITGTCGSTPCST